ncbi:MMPL family transporter [Actinomadura parmotrematis]|uniref:MMPL family transporter n=1 Tax=Actinomadura parmotrematis TaxID=2864039 RepID=A0ABS7FNY4_9ACTN|nr:MMPL family transporter [Actinomadura parmotrematis]MBW8481710.1 MMPL family transporter [Actinomadura parmotrematis]
MTSPLERCTAAICGRRGKWAVLLIWALLFALLFPLAGKLGDVKSNDASAWLPDGTESTKVIQLDDRFAVDQSELAVIVYERPSGITAADRAKAAADGRAFAALPGAGTVRGPLPAQDGRALQTLVPIDRDHVTESVDQARALLKRAPPGLAAHVTGSAGGDADGDEIFDSVDGFLLMAAGIVVIVLLLLLYRSPVLWLVPLLCVIFALVSAQAAVYLLAKHAGLTVNGQSASILTVMVFGIATDYALLLVARYREELHRHADRHAAMARALHRAGPTLAASAATVAAALLCLLAAEMNSASGFGPVAAAGVLTGFAAMVTLLPALLVVLGRWLFWPLVPRHDARYLAPEAYEAEHGVWSRVARLVTRRPRALWAVTSLVLVGLTFGLGSLNGGGITDKGSFTGRPDSVQGLEAVERHFPNLQGDPAVVIGDAAAAGPLRAAIAGTPGITSVERTGGKDGLVRFEAVLSASDGTGAAQRTVERLRGTVHAVPGAHALVGGSPAVSLDTDRASAHDNRTVIPLALVVVLLILVVLLRALVAPLLMIATVVLSFLASLGTSAFLFRHVMHYEGTDRSFPLLAFVFLVALGVDYNIFLMHRVREESRRLGTRRGIVRGVTVTGGVITSAGLVLAATFAALATLPITELAELGFAVALGVLLDTFVVRTLLMPALAHDLGDRVWAPRLRRRGGRGADRTRSLEPVS